MKITRRDLGVLLIIAGILIAFLSYKMSFEGTLEEIDAIQAEQDKLNKEIADLQPLVDAAPRYEKEMKDMDEKTVKIMNEFAPDIWQEDNIMYVVEILDELNTKIPSFSAAPAVVVQTVDGTGALAGRSYSLGRATIGATYISESYDDLKAYIDYIYSDKKVKRVIDNINMTFDVTDGKISGSTTIYQYVMNDTTRTYDPVELPDDDLGIESECIFGETEEATEEADE